MQKKVALFCWLGALACAHRQTPVVMQPPPSQTAKGPPEETLRAVRSMVYPRKVCQYHAEFKLESKFRSATANVFLCDARDAPPPAPAGNPLMKYVMQSFEEMLVRNNIRGATLHIDVVRGRIPQKWTFVLIWGDQMAHTYIESEAPSLFILMQGLDAYKTPDVSSPQPPQIDVPKYPPRSL